MGALDDKPFASSWRDAVVLASRSDTGRRRRLAVLRNSPPSILLTAREAELARRSRTGIAKRYWQRRSLYWRRDVLPAKNRSSHLYFFSFVLLSFMIFMCSGVMSVTLFFLAQSTQPFKATLRNTLGTLVIMAQASSVNLISGSIRSAA